jgi:hypothetical protein
MFEQNETQGLDQQKRYGSRRQQLLTYPLTDVDHGLVGGYGRIGVDFEETVGLAARAVGRRGQVAVVAHLATPVDRSTRLGPAAGEVRVEVLTSYEALRRFSAELVLLVRGSVEEAGVDADVLG